MQQTTDNKITQWLLPIDWLDPIVYDEYSGFPDKEECDVLYNELKQIQLSK